MFEWYFELPLPGDGSQIAEFQEIYYSGNVEGFNLFKKEILDFLEDLGQNYSHITEGEDIIYTSRTDINQHINIEDGKFE